MLPDYLDCLTYHPSYLCRFIQYVQPKTRTHKQQDTEENLIQHGQSGYMTAGAAKRVKELTTSLILAYHPSGQYSKKRGKDTMKEITFITLTLPARQRHTDKEIKREALDQFIKELIRRSGVTAYIWRAEPQKNGNIHFHILANRKVHWADIRANWNKKMAKLGYIDGYKQKLEKLTLDEYIKLREAKTEAKRLQAVRAYEFGQNTAWENPNSTDIHSIQKIQNLTSYLVKYMAKGEAYRKIEGAIWGASSNLKKLVKRKVVINADWAKAWFAIERAADYKLIKNENFTIKLGDVYRQIEKELPELYAEIQQKHIEDRQILEAK